MRRSDVIDRFGWISLLVAHELTPQGLDRIHGTDDSNMNNTRTLVKGNGESKSHEQKSFHFLRWSDLQVGFLSPRVLELFTYLLNSKILLAYCIPLGRAYPIRDGLTFRSMLSLLCSVLH